MANMETTQSSELMKAIKDGSERAILHGLLTEFIWSIIEITKSNPDIDPVDIIYDSLNEWDV